MFSTGTRLAIRTQLEARHALDRLRDERGASAVEYALMVGLIAIVIIVAVTTLGNNLTSRFSSVASSI